MYLMRMVGCALALGTLLGACSAADLINRGIGSERVTEQTDLAYGPGPWGTYDLYTPDAPSGPVVVFLQGGAWAQVEKGYYRFVGVKLAEDHGWTVAIPDYTPGPRDPFPRFVEDAARAIETIRRDVADGAPIWLIGHSAGAHIGALITHDPSYLDACEAIAGFVGIAGPYDLDTIEDWRMPQLFPPSLRDRAQVINAVEGAAPPTLLLYGQNDDIVDPENIERFEAALRAAGQRVEARIYEDVRHLDILGVIGDRLDSPAPTQADIVRFVAETPPGC
ncbi:alpha/beta hydrolase [Pontivivens insulae]|uniref:BD-FAE-like domain-containing protein n=1 Tax=Pontivivens insulae TaxID=1639689 RepID=A0A2R8AF68_9RHOB|nr:alpha/beta hydrolase [Pontivivens insulae]RED12137.1 acetyl esterase/lipase [Pontivivens insulae]SPF30893.1 hypothetical protein POI8812_03238 [Pontivivens insulae]